MKWTYNSLYQKLTSSQWLIPQVGPMTADDVEILRQAEAVYREFGEMGLKRFYEALEAKGEHDHNQKTP